MFRNFCFTLSFIALTSEVRMDVMLILLIVENHDSQSSIQWHDICAKNVVSFHLVILGQELHTDGQRNVKHIAIYPHK
jgi:hypothetical protein